MQNEVITYSGNGKRVAYISGAITLEPNYRDFFAKAEKFLNDKDFIVLNPAKLPAGMEHSKYLPINDAMISVSDEFYLIPGWEESIGCNHEVRTAKSLGKEIHVLSEKIFKEEL